MVPPPSVRREEHTTAPGGKDDITLFADASFCPETKAYGWCFWLRHGQDGKITIRSGGGTRIKSSQEAEIEALRQGLRAIYSRAFGGKNILVHSDCLGALFKIGVEIEAIKQAGAAGVYTKHVKGHRGQRNEASAINTKCDKEAGKQMRWYRREKRQELSRAQKPADPQKIGPTPARKTRRSRRKMSYNRTTTQVLAPSAWQDNTITANPITANPTP